jgi:hypothetical protein
MPSSGMCRRVAPLRTDVSEKRIASIVRVNRNSVLRLLVTVNVVPSSLIVFTLMMEVIFSPETSVMIRATRRQVPEDILQWNERDHKMSPPYVMCRATTK